MGNLNFANLDWKEFESLALDVMKKQLGCRLERFGAGKDGGIDITNNSITNEIVIQSKHYPMTSSTEACKLICNEYAKICQLQPIPKKYYIFTSASLLPQHVSKIRKVFQEYMDSDAQIIYREKIEDFFNQPENLDIYEKHLSLFESHMDWYKKKVSATSLSTGKEAPKVVSILYASNDWEWAKQICEDLESEDITCILISEDMNESLDLKLYAQTRLAVCLVSRYFLTSKCFIHEIAELLKNNIDIFSVRLDSTQWNGAIAYYLSADIEIDMRENKAESFDTLIRKIYLHLGRNDIFEARDTARNIDSEEMIFENNVDNSLNAKFKELFEEKKEIEEKTNEDNVSPLKKKMIERIAKHQFKRMMEEPEEETDTDEGTNSEEKNLGKYITLNTTEAVTSLFVISKVIDPKTYKHSYKTTYVEREEWETSDHKLFSKYYFPKIDKNGNPVITLSFMRDMDICNANMGFLNQDTFQISKQPKGMEFGEVKNKGNTVKHFLVNEEDLTIIVDPETGLPLIRKRYYDRKEKKWIHYVDMFPYKRYFAFQIKNKCSDTTDMCTVGEGYYEGRYGLPKNILKAAECFEKAGTAKAYRYLCKIFSEDPLLKDEEDAAYYSRLAETNGDVKNGLLI